MAETGFKIFEDAVNAGDFVKLGETSHFVVKEEVVVLSLHDAAEQALWDLRQWVKNHPKPCECFTCGDSIPDLERALNPPAEFHGICC